MLRIVEDDVKGGRLVATARFPRPALLVRRLAVTAVTVWLFVVIFTSGMPVGEQLICLALACLPLLIPPRDVARLVVDGRERAVLIRRRGWLAWIGRTRRLSADEGFELRGGAPSESGHQPEIGLEIVAGNQGFAFTVRGVDRRDEVRAFAAAIAARLGVGIDPVRDDAFSYAVRIHPGGEPTDHALGGYRAARARPETLSTDRKPSFEEPPTTVPAKRAGDLRDTVERCDEVGGHFAVSAAEWPASPLARLVAWARTTARPWLVRAAMASGLLGLVGGIISLSMGHGFGPGALIGAFVVAFFAGLALFALSMQHLMLHGLIFVLCGRWFLFHGAPDTPGGWLDLWPRHWAIDVARREIVTKHLVLRRRRSLAGAQCLGVASDWFEGSRFQHVLWLRLGFRWVRLASGKPKEGSDPSDGMIALAVALGRALDLPLRAVSPRHAA